MAQVLARVRKTGVATPRDFINFHGNALDEGVAAWGAVQKEADGAVKGGALGGAAGYLRRLLEGDGGAATHFGFGRVKYDD